MTWKTVQSKNNLWDCYVNLRIGKNKVNYVDYLDCGDYVVVVNAAQLAVTGRKLTQKFYRRHSGFPGGFKEVRLDWQMKTDPTKVVRHAVSGMLPKNKLQDPRLARLKIFADEEHPYADKLSK
ncbi:50S ribosomal protein L13 [Patescibacteria group bacterium]|nr:50S ribosomal protein L13 [Patescibacteria group bacterium]